ncbi:MAG: ATPase [Ruminococcus sp.]|nr:ATPase [Ruminococcus sp.]
MDIKDMILKGDANIGIELGSTRIKAVLIGLDMSPVASGVYDWASTLDNGIWTYPDEQIRQGVRSCFQDLIKNVKEHFGVTLTTVRGIGISAMMHGYLAFDKEGRLLVPFRTWRNTITAQAADRLTKELSFNIPERWTVAHLYQAILNDEEHIDRIEYVTTLAGYVHMLLTGKKVIGVGDASGIFPIDDNGCYNAAMAEKFDALTNGTRFKKKLLDVLPQIVSVGESAGVLTDEGAALLDPTGSFKAGVPLCPPEGDAQTGMVATNSIAPKTGNVSAGTSVFSMIVLEKALKNVHKEIDIVTTPDGAPVAMVHCNNCTTDLDAWVDIFASVTESAGAKLSKGELYDMLYALAAKADKDCGGIVTYNYYAGEQLTSLSSGRPMVVRTPDSAFTIGNLVRSLVYSCFATLKIGTDILTREEKVSVDRIYAHGGLFKTPEPSQNILAAALGVDVTLNSAAGEGGAWGIALLAAFMSRSDRSQGLQEFLESNVFKGVPGRTVSPDKLDAEGFEKYMERFKAYLPAQRAANG